MEYTNYVLNQCTPSIQASQNETNKWDRLEEEDEDFLSDISKEELLVVMKSFKMERNPNPYGWTIEFFLASFDLLGDY